MFAYIRKAGSGLYSPVKSGLRRLNHQPYAEEDNVEVQRLPTNLFQRISFPTVISALLSLTFRGLLTPLDKQQPLTLKELPQLQCSFLSPPCHKLVVSLQHAASKNESMHLLMEFILF